MAACGSPIGTPKASRIASAGRRTLRSMIAHLATMIRYAGIAYIVIQVAIWHSFYTQSPWRLLAPALAVADQT